MKLGLQALRNALRRLAHPRAARQAAALPWRADGRGGIEVLLVTTRVSGRWVVPKGWPERGEPLPDAAAREAFEEAGLRGAVAREAVGRYTYRKTRRSRRARRCEVLVYPMQVAQAAESWPERKQRRRAWLTPDEAASRVGPAGLARIIRRFTPSQAAD